VLVRWQSVDGTLLTLVANLKSEPAAELPAAAGSLLWQEGHVDAAGTFGSWTVRWSVRT